MLGSRDLEVSDEGGVGFSSRRRMGCDDNCRLGRGRRSPGIPSLLILLLGVWVNEVRIWHWIQIDRRESSMARSLIIRATCHRRGFPSFLRAPKAS